MRHDAPRRHRSHHGHHGRRPALPGLLRGDSRPRLPRPRSGLRGPRLASDPPRPPGTPGWRPALHRGAGHRPRPRGQRDGPHAAAGAFALPPRSATGPSGSRRPASRSVRSRERTRERSLRFADPEGLEHELAAEAAGDGHRPGARLGADPARARDRAASPGCRAYGRESVPSADILAGRLGFEVTGPDSYAVGGRAGELGASPSTRRPPRGAWSAPGTIHHIAWACRRRPAGLAPAGDRHGMHGDAGDRPRPLPLDLLPGALRGAVRDRHARAGHRRGGTPSRRSRTERSRRRSTPAFAPPVVG